ncbi:LVIVD repeat-containing protein [Pyxidicoccus sp. 3LFB2]
MPPARAALTVLLACAASALGCGAPEAPPWDGSYVPLEERGDWEDPGPLSTCQVRRDGAAPCGSLDSFDLSRCKPRSLEQLERTGVFRAELRYEAEGTPEQAPPRVGGGGFKLAANGAPELVFGAPGASAVWTSRTLLVSGRKGDSLYTFVGCNAVSPRVLTGCFSVCRDEQLVETATFRAERMSRFNGESEASGGLGLLSESFVEAGAPVDVHVTAGHAHVISESRPGRPGGLTVFDVSNPRAPVAVGRLAAPGDANWKGVTSVEGVLYVATENAGVAVVDISEPSRPTFVRAVPGGPLQVSSTSVFGNRLYVTVEAPEPGTLLFDISTPAEPRLVESVTLGKMDPDRPYSSLRSASIHEDRLYVSHPRNGFLVADISNPDAVSLLGTYTYPYGSSAASVVGTFAGRPVAFELGRGVGARLRVLDVSAPARIVKMGEYGLRHVVSPRDLELRGTRLYLTYHQEGLRVLDMSRPTQPREQAWFNTYRESDPGRGDGVEEGAAGLHVPGDGHVYVVDTARGLLVLNEP